MSQQEQPPDYKPGPKPVGRMQTSMSMNLAARRIWCEKARRLGVSRAAVIEMAVRQLAKRILSPRAFSRAINGTD